MVDSGHRQVEHTADLAIELWAPSEALLLREGALAVVEILTEGHPPAASETRTLQIESIDAGDRLVQWLNEIIYLATVDGFVTADASIVLAGSGLTASVRGNQRDGIKTEIKSATYHDLRLEKVDGSWRARVVLDV
jgi:SHS2 domain-containing protein